MDNEVEKIKVTLELDYQQYLRDVEKAVAEAVRKMKETETPPQKARTAWEQLGGYLKGQFLTILTGIGAAMAAAFSVGAVVNFFKTIASGMVSANSQFETFTVQFETLLGSTSEAKKRIDELAAFGQATPFELDEIAEADRLLQTFGGTALATGENLRRVGDSAAAVNASFQEVSFWTGRLYSSMLAGRPFGEASARLQELGIMSGDVRTKLEEMQKAGADGAEIWAVYAETIDSKFAGAMDKLSKTLQGVMSNLADFQSMLLREGGEQLFEGVREDAIEFYDIINDPEAKEALTNLAKAFGDILDSLREAATTPFLESLQDVDPAQAESLAASIQDISEAIGGISGLNITSISSLVDTLDGMVQSAASLIQLVEIFKELTLTVSGLRALNQAGIEFGEIFGPLLNPVYGLAQAVDNLNENIKKTTGSSLSEWVGGVEEPAMAAASSLDAMGFAADGVPPALRGAGEAALDAAEDFTKAREKMDGLISSFQDAQTDINEKRAEAAKDHGERLADIEEAAGERQADIIKDYNEKIADLEEDGRERREEIAESTAEALTQLAEDTAKQRAEAEESARMDLADLETSTQEEIAQVREEAHEKEKEETEAHQREMRQLQENYMFDLEDAVKSRDARAIVDLRRRYQQEKKEREESFEEKKSEGGEDVESRVDEIRETEQKRRVEIQRSLQRQLQDLERNEADKRQEIMISQEKQLEELAENEAEKRREIRESLDEQIAEANEKYAEQIAAENEKYAERQEALDEALAKRLEQVAQELADEKEITEEGAEAILETLNEHFGVGGSIDELMEDFRNRRKEKVTISMEFEEEVREASEGGRRRGGVGGGSSRGRGLRQFAEGGIVPGFQGEAQMAVVHGGELIVPYEQVRGHLEGMRDSMALNFSGQQELNVNVNVTGDKMGRPETDALAGVLVRAFNEAGIKTRQR